MSFKASSPRDVRETNKDHQLQATSEACTCHTERTISPKEQPQDRAGVADEGKSNVQQLH